MRTYNVYDFLEWRELDDNHPYVKDLSEKKKSKINVIYERAGGDIIIEYKNGKTEDYQNVFGSFVLLGC